MFDWTKVLTCTALQGPDGARHPFPNLAEESAILTFYLSTPTLFPQAPDLLDSNLSGYALATFLSAAIWF